MIISELMSDLDSRMVLCNNIVIQSLWRAKQALKIARMRFKGLALLLKLFYFKIDVSFINSCSSNQIVVSTLLQEKEV
jgi:hypothetical protein